MGATTKRGSAGVSAASRGRLPAEKGRERMADRSVKKRDKRRSRKQPHTKLNQAGKELEARIPPELETRMNGDASAGKFWPEGRAMPETFKVRRPIPCPACRMVSLPSTSQAVVIRTVNKGVAYLRCRGCDHQFKMRAELV